MVDNRSSSIAVMKKRFAISTLLVLLLLVVSQIIWIRQVAERDKSRFREEVNASINDIVKYQATKQTYELFEIDPESPSITITAVNPDSLSANAKSYGSYETESYEENTSIANFLEAAMTEMLLEENTLDLNRIDSLFRNNFLHTSELSAYSFITKEKDTTTDSLYFGINAMQQLNDTTKGVYITVPLGTSGTYRFVSHFIFKPATDTRRMTILVIISGVAVVAVALIFFVLLVQLQRQMHRLYSQEKRVRGIIHDLKSPLSYIFSMLGFFEMEDKNNLLAEGKSRVKQLSDNIERMLSEVKLNEKKSAALQREPYDLAQHCREISHDLEMIYKEKDITMTFTIAREAQVIYVDPFYFDSCLRNLLDNAIKYSGDAPVITLTAGKEKNRILIRVADNGMGIPKKDQRRIFTSFFRSPRQSSVKGHGIGLSSAKQIVKAHGGNIGLKSEEGKGTVFTISIPDKQ
ncbi:Histidine kinase-, DNA gyrase B-, and HSP90-like ATPase [Porphyromonadaceae bacterium KH3R12]|nr:Histidine kinase-, DNA gyrase B-, and HSP90-like ATPase [Porphyromonadaceae bacterium KH3R12]